VWDSRDALAAARHAMIETLDRFRDMLEDLGGELGVDRSRFRRGGVRGTPLVSAFGLGCGFVEDRHPYRFYSQPHPSPSRSRSNSPRPTTLTGHSRAPDRCRTPPRICVAGEWHAFALIARTGKACRTIGLRTAPEDGPIGANSIGRGRPGDEGCFVGPCRLPIG
jgi:hypothetical protein